MEMASIKGHESMSYGTMLAIAGLLFKFTIVKMRGPNKPLNHKKILPYLTIVRSSTSLLYTET